MVFILIIFIEFHIFYKFSGQKTFFFSLVKYVRSKCTWNKKLRAFTFQTKKK